MLVKNSASAAAPQPPVAKKIPHTTNVHGLTLTDDYFWLREKENRAVLKHLKAENDYTEALMKPTKKLQAALYTEMVARIKETDTSAPVKDGEWWHYTRTVKGKQYPIICRKFRSLDAKEEIVLDLNQLARGHKYLGLGEFDYSDDENLLAYSLDFTGFRQYTLFVKDLRTGKLGPEKIEKTGSVSWAADNRTLFYTVEDEAKRQYRAYRHTLGAKKDELIFEEKDELFDVHVDRTRSKEFLFLGSVSKTTTEFRSLRANDPLGKWKLVAKREQDHEYYPDHHGDKFFIRSNKGGRNFQLVTAPVSDPKPANWAVLVPHDPKVMLMDAELFADHYVLHEREDGLPQLRITDFTGGASHRIAMPEPTYEVSPELNPEFGSRKFRYEYQSLVTPRSIYEYDLATKTAKLLKVQEIPSGYRAEDYATERIFATAGDGTRVPASVVFKKSTARDGSAPLLLDGYGSYGLPNEAEFSSTRLSLLDRGFIFAIAHIRGGGEMGKPWHDAGRMMNKRNTFTDFIAAAEHLVAKRYTSRERLMIEGGSAGGMLMGAVLNMRPDLFHAVVMQVPFVDVMNTMLDESLPLTVTEFEEWGNPKQRAAFDYMMSYSPYDNVRAQKYPAVLVETSLFDSQVMYWEPAKFVAKLRALKTDENPLLMKVNLAAGHGGASGRYDYLKEIAFTYSFLLWQAGMK
ncbi:MAG: S9 family peptidase [Verrucomicrobia bacterium]|nr:S9 family peptidase [Verrucomicrobiota bacterium]